MNFRSPSSKVVTFQFQSSTRSALLQLRLTSPELRMRGPVGLMSRNWREGPSTFAKLSRILPQTFAEIWLEVALSLPQQLQNLLAGGCFCSGVLLRRPSSCAFSAQLESAGILRALPKNTHGSSLQLPVSKPHKSFAEEKIFRDPLRGTFAKVNAKTKRSSPS